MPDRRPRTRTLAGMGFYVRKALRAGPFRVNVSRSGLGLSVGVRGARFGAGPRGGYGHAGRGGLYFRHTLSARRRGRAGAGRPAEPRPGSPMPPQFTAYQARMRRCTALRTAGLFGVVIGLVLAFALPAGLLLIVLGAGLLVAAGQTRTAAVAALNSTHVTPPPVRAVLFGLEQRPVGLTVSTLQSARVENGVVLFPGGFLALFAGEVWCAVDGVVTAAIWDAPIPGSADLLLPETLPGLTVIGEQFLHPRIDGAADRRYEHNPRLPLVRAEVQLLPDGMALLLDDVA